MRTIDCAKSYAGDDDGFIANVEELLENEGVWLGDYDLAEELVRDAGQYANEHGVPLINGMIDRAHDNPHEREYNDAPGDATPAALLEGYGVRDEDDDGDGMYGTAGMPDVDAVIHVLEGHWSWGEFLGGTLRAMAMWDEATRERVLPALKHAVARAAVSGVDH